MTNDHYFSPAQMQKELNRLKNNQTAKVIHQIEYFLNNTQNYTTANSLNLQYGKISGYLECLLDTQKISGDECEILDEISRTICVDTMHILERLKLNKVI